MLKIGHRGASGLAPENTMAAFSQAIDSNLDMVELDIQLTKDEELVVFHDDDLSRIAGVNKQVDELNLKELKELDIGSWFEDRYSSERISTLQEVIKLVKDDLRINIEIKMIRSNYSLLINKLLEVLREEDFSQQIIISSFNHQLLKQLKAVNPKLKTAILLAALPVNPFRLVEWANADGIHPHYGMVSERFLLKAKENNLFINAWTVNSKDEMKRLKSLGVDGIMTDHPRLFDFSYL